MKAGHLGRDGIEIDLRLDPELGLALSLPFVPRRFVRAAKLCGAKESDGSMERGRSRFESLLLRVFVEELDILAR